MRMRVALPHPLAPIRPYRFPSPNLTLMFSNRGFAPNWSVMLAAVSTVFRDVCDVGFKRRGAWRRARRSGGNAQEKPAILLESGDYLKRDGRAGRSLRPET